MTVEAASLTMVQRPWGQSDLEPWSGLRDVRGPVGEIWFGRADPEARQPRLLLKLLFAAKPLSIQVHPGDAYAQAHGEPNGKSEAWYVLSAEPDARVATGLTRALTADELGLAILDGSIAGLVNWRHVAAGQAIAVPAGTIHAIGAGLVIAEIQQRSDTTFRLFDFGRGRPLHPDEAIKVAKAGPSGHQAPPMKLTDVRTLLVATPAFVLERIDIPPHSHWELSADNETWLFVISGKPRLGEQDAEMGRAFFLEKARAGISGGRDGASLLIAYPGPDPASSLLYNVEGRKAAPVAGVGAAIASAVSVKEAHA